MTHSSPRFRILLQLATCASCVGLSFACGGTTEGDSHGDMTDGPTTDSGPTTSGGNGGDTTTGGGNGGGGNGAVTTGVVSNCPSLEPAAGAECSVDASLVCEYSNCTAPDYRDAHTLFCIEGAWQLTEVYACDNVPTTCPPSVSRGAYCDLPEGSGPCSVVDACGALRSTYCTNGIWEYGSGTGEDAAPIIPGSGGAGTGPSSATVTTSPPPEPKCPEIIPEWGTACCPADYPPYCDWTLTSSNVAGGSPSAATGGVPNPAVTGTGSGFGTGGPLLPCAMCGADMTWQATTCP